MSSKEVSAKLTADEFDRFLKICKTRNCTPSEMIKKLILSVIETSGKKQTTTSSQNEVKAELQEQSFDESAIVELIKKIENDKLSEKGLQELYVKLGEKLEKNNLTKPEEMLFRKVHQKLRDRLLQYVAETKTLSVEERFQYF